MIALSDLAPPWDCYVAGLCEATFVSARIVERANYKAVTLVWVGLHGDRMVRQYGIYR